MMWLNSTLLVLFFIFVHVAGQAADPDTYVLLVTGSKGSVLRQTVDAESAIIGSVSEGSIIAAYEEVKLESGKLAYRVGETEGWISENVQVVTRPSRAATVETNIASASAEPVKETEEKVDIPAAAPETEATDAKDEVKEESTLPVSSTSAIKSFGVSAVGKLISTIKDFISAMRGALAFVQKLLGSRK